MPARGSSKVDTVILGSGPTAVFLTAWLGLRSPGERVVRIGQPGQSSLDPRLATGRLVTLVPVLPVIPAPAWPPAGMESGTLKIDLKGETKTIARGTAGGHAFVDWALERGSPLAASMAVKQFGSVAATRRLCQVENKIRRVYEAAAHVQRAGYRNGLSPYWYSYVTLQNCWPGRQAQQIEVDTQRRIVRTQEHGNVKYDRLISTQPLPQLCEQVGVPTPHLLAASATFVLAACQDRVESNHMIYDLDPSTCVFRAISVSTRHVLIHLRHQEEGARAPVKQAIARAADLLGVALRGESGAVRILNAYPLARPSGATYDYVESRLSAGNILRFGRLAEWRYVDLHELDWLGLL